MNEFEATVWCPKCQKVFYEIYRVPSNNPGVFHHVRIPDLQEYKKCECGNNLERK
jgi:hypothetical protein